MCWCCRARVAAVDDVEADRELALRCADRASGDDDAIEHASDAPSPARRSADGRGVAAPWREHDLVAARGDGDDVRPASSSARTLPTGSPSADEADRAIERQASPELYESRSFAIAATRSSASRSEIAVARTVTATVERRRPVSATARRSRRLAAHARDCADDARAKRSAAPTVPSERDSRRPSFTASSSDRESG